MVLKFSLYYMCMSVVTANIGKNYVNICRGICGLLNFSINNILHLQYKNRRDEKSE
jgi:hypothetical protein